MSELRKDPIVDRWVVISPTRPIRPLLTAADPPRGAAGFCPFCSGNESATPPEILAYRAAGGVPNEPGWTVRVVPNRLPALRVEGQLERSGEGMYDRMSGIGAHEVIVETPEHAARPATMPEAALAALFGAYRDRLNDLARDERLRYGLVFKNHGVRAGAQLSHPHSQLVALPLVPAAVEAELGGAAAHYARKQRCLYCDILDQELSDGRRVILEGSAFVALAPFAARVPFETWILPRRHASAFERITQEELVLLARTLRSTMQRLDAALEEPSFGWLLHTAPLRDPASPHYHWHLEILPAPSALGAFEWGTGLTINPTPPEEAARFLRELPEILA